MESWVFGLFILGCAGSLLLGTGTLVAAGRAALLCSARPARCSGFSCCGARAVEHGLGSCGSRALLLRSLWNFSRPRIKPMAPALASGFPSTAPPGKFQEILKRETTKLCLSTPVCFLEWHCYSSREAVLCAAAVFAEGGWVEGN